MEVVVMVMTPETNFFAKDDRTWQQSIPSHQIESVQLVSGV
jgi:hypothetical protein